MAASAAWFASLLLVAPQGPAAGTAGEPPRIEWQRSLADALAVQQATGLPLLIAVNMDGEVFNERFANTTYRDPAFVASTRGYVCVVASPDRHSERDYDALGNRVECPRFPGCTCSEHIAIEPELFARWFGGTRNAPRHVGVSAAGKVLFDRFLDHSMQTAIDAIRQHGGTPRPGALLPTTDLAALFARRDAAARRTVEALWRDGDVARRRAVLAAAAGATNEPWDLLRAALRADADSALRAAQALAHTATAAARIDVEDALAIVVDAATQQALTARLQELGAGDPATARLSAHLAAPADPMPAPWGGPWGKAAFDAADRASIEAELDRCEAARRQAPDDGLPRLQLATAQAALAGLLAATGGRGAELWYEDARSNASRVAGAALQAEAKAVLAIASWHSGDATSARLAATQALAAPSQRQPDAWLAAAFVDVLLPLTAQSAYGRAEADPAAVLRGELGRVLGALQLLDERGGGGDTGSLAGIGLLEWCGLRGAAQRHLQALAGRVPASSAAHERWRTRLLVDRGAEALLRAYEQFVATARERPTAAWFAGYAALVAGDQHTRDRRAAPARTAYGAAIQWLEQSVAGNADYADSAWHFAVLALAGRAEVALELGDAETAVADLLRAAQLRPASLDETDGLQRKPRAIAGRVARALQTAGKVELAARLQPLLP